MMNETHNQNYNNNKTTKPNNNNKFHCFSF